MFLNVRTVAPYIDECQNGRTVTLLSTIRVHLRTSRVHLSTFRVHLRTFRVHLSTFRVY